MAQLRVVDPHGLYHVMSRGNHRQTIFPSEDHIARYVFLLARVTARRRWIVVDWVLMLNHVHLLIQLTDGGLSEGMRELNGCYSRWSHEVHGLTGTGHLVKNRFKSKLVETESYALQLLRYIPLNPVRVGWAGTPAAWRWSGFRAIAGLDHPLPFHRPSEARRYFGASPRDAQQLYQQHVQAGLVLEDPDPWSDDVVESRV